MLLCCCIILGLFTVLPVTAQGGDYTRISMPLSYRTNDYAEIAYILPSQVNVTTDAEGAVRVLNYTGGREVKASILLNGSRVGLYLLYPCQPPQTLLEPEPLKSLLAASDPAILKANYSDTLLGISGRPAIWGLMANLVFAAYQPTNQTAAVIVMDGTIPEETMAEFIGNLTITPNEGVSPLVPGYCPDTTVAPLAVATVAPPANTVAATVAPTDAAAISDEATAVDDTAPSAPVTENPTLAETVKDTAASAKEKQAADRAAALAKLDEMKQRRR
jgi:hypothetical protein